MAAAAAPWVEAGPFRAHLRHVMAVGDLTATEVATLAGVSPRMAASLLTGRGGRPVRRISPDTARSLLRVTAADARALRTRQVPAEESRLRLRRLLVRGMDPADLAEQLGVTSQTVAALASGTGGWCGALLALRLLALARAVAAGEHTADPAARVAA
jgi:plasmid maintenance system antidote protein VapI